MAKTSPAQLFNHKRRIAIEARSVRIAKPDADFLACEAASIIIDRLAATQREFPVTADLFSAFDCMKGPLACSSKTDKIYRVSNSALEVKSSDTGRILGERDLISLKPASTNLITSVFGLHWCNDLPGTLSQIRQSLVEDGLFMAALPGDRTLGELRQSLLAAESELSGNASLRVEPFGEVRQFGGLLQRAGFTLPVVDTELFTVRYAGFRELVEDLRAMGATSSLAQRATFGPRELFNLTEQHYNQIHRDEDGRVRATFEVVFLSGWSPHASQQVPLKSGSAKNLLKDFL